MPLTHKLSDVVDMRIDRDTKGNPVLELDLRFVRYRLTIDNTRKAEKLAQLINMSTRESEPRKAHKDESMPKFYKTQDTEKPQ